MIRRFILCLTILALLIPYHVDGKSRMTTGLWVCEQLIVEQPASTFVSYPFYGNKGDIDFTGTVVNITPSWWVGGAWTTTEPSPHSIAVSTIGANHREVVAYLRIDSPSSGDTSVTFNWYKGASLIYTLTNVFTLPVGLGFFYTYMCLSWITGQIEANGDYSCEVDVTGANTYTTSKDFTISGINSVGEPGHMWMELDPIIPGVLEIPKLSYICSSGARVDLTCNAPDPPITALAGHIWIEGSNIALIGSCIYLTTPGVVKATVIPKLISGKDPSYEDEPGGQIWIEGTILYYTGSDGTVYRCIEYPIGGE